MPPLSLGALVTGFQPAALDLAALLPFGVAGCMLWTTADAIGLLVPTAGSAPTTITIPADLALAGLSFQQQVVVVELDAAAAIVAVTSSDALGWTIGSL
jgi:hypothetical protein